MNAIMRKMRHHRKCCNTKQLRRGNNQQQPLHFNICFIVVHNFCLVVNEHSREPSTLCQVEVEAAASTQDWGPNRLHGTNCPIRQEIEEQLPRLLFGQEEHRWPWIHTCLRNSKQRRADQSLQAVRGVARQVLRRPAFEITDRVGGQVSV